MNGTIGYLGDDSGSGSLSYKAALMQVLQKNTTFSYEMDYSAENSDFQTSGNLDPEHTQIQKEDSGMMHPEEYTEGEGELDMLIGYFIMNLICIVFFLMFGMCVICSCMRRRPKLFRAKNEEPEPNPRKNRLFSFKRASTPKMNFVAPPPITTPGLKPTFKAIVSKAIASDDFKKMVETSKKENSEGPGTQRRCSGAGLNPNEKARLLRRNSECHRGKRDVQIEMEGHEDAFRCKSVTNDVKIQIEPSDPSENNTTLQLPVPNGGLNQGQNKICPACHPETRTDPNHVCDCTCKNEEEIEEESSEDDSSEGQPSVVRQNLLGPLTFDDLYYT